MLRYLFIKELLTLAVLTGLGAGFAAQLRGDVRGLARWTLAPAFGLAAGMGLLTTVAVVTPLRHAFWFAVLPAMALSLAWAFRRERAGVEPGSLRRRLRASLPGLAVVAVVVAVPLFVLNAPLDARSSQGPIAFGIFDSPQYVNYIQGYQNGTNGRPVKEILFPFVEARYDDQAWAPKWNLTQRVGWGFKWQHASASAIAASLAGAFGWAPYQTQSPFSMALVLVAALGATGLTLFVTRGALWAGLFAGLACAGPILFQLWVDGSQGLLSGVALIPAFLVTCWLFVRHPGTRLALLTGLLLAGFGAGYAEFTPQAAGTLGLAALAAVAVSRRRRPLAGELTRYGALAVIAGIAASPRTAIWVGEYIRRQITDSEALIAVTPSKLYDMSIEGLPAWLLQTREFYLVAFADPGGTWFTVVGILLPLALVAAAAFAWVRLPASRILLAFTVVACAQAAYVAIRLDCHYCVQRTLATLAPVAAAGVWAGLYALWRTRRDPVMLTAGVLGGIAVAATVSTTGVVSDRTREQAVMAYPGVPAVLDRAARLPRGILNLEGFNATAYDSWLDQPSWYQAASQRTSHRLSTTAAYNDYAGFWYTQIRPVGDPSYRPDYDYVLSRMGSLDTGRPVLYRHGPIVLARRARPFDVSVVRGVAVDTPRRDPAGSAWVQRPNNTASLNAGPLTFWVSAMSPRKAAVILTLAGPPELRVRRRSGVVQKRLSDGRLWACLPAPGRGRLRIVSAAVTPVAPEMGPPLNPPYDPAPTPAKVTRLVSVRAAAVDCNAATRARLRSRT